MSLSIRDIERLVYNYVERTAEEIIRLVLETVDNIATAFCGAEDTADKACGLHAGNTTSAQKAAS